MLTWRQKVIFWVTQCSLFSCTWYVSEQMLFSMRFLSTSNSESAERRIFSDLTLLAFALPLNAALRTQDLQERVQVCHHHPAVRTGDSSVLPYFCRRSRRLHHHIPSSFARVFNTWHMCWCRNRLFEALCRSLVRHVLFYGNRRPHIMHDYFVLSGNLMSMILNCIGTL